MQRNNVAWMAGMDTPAVCAASGKRQRYCPAASAGETDLFSDVRKMYTGSHRLLCFPDRIPAPTVPRKVAPGTFGAIHPGTCRPAHRQRNPKQRPKQCGQNWHLHSTHFLCVYAVVAPDALPPVRPLHTGSPPARPKGLDICRRRKINPYQYMGRRRKDIHLKKIL